MEERIHFFNSAGERLSGTLHLPANVTDMGVVLCHCFTCSRHTSILRQICGDLSLSGIAALRFDFSGNGQSEGDFAQSTYTKMIGEVGSALARLEQEGIARLALAGHSMGATISLLVAGQQDRVAAVCAIAGRLSGADPRTMLGPAQQAELEATGSVAFVSRGRDLKLTQGFFTEARRYDLQAVLTRLGKPLLVIHGDRDEIVPVLEADLARRTNARWAEVAVIAGADHMFSNEAHRRQVSGTAVSWLRARLSETAGG